jgi:DNA-binding transcriptional regulator LsrR (DeoR family)
MSLDQMKKAKRSVGIAGGPRKTRAIRSALRGGYINVLITDRRTAERLLDHEALQKETA